MKRLFQYCIAIGVIALFGCAIKLVDVKQDIPDMQMKGKFPLKVALLISQESLDVDTVTNLGSECIGKSNNFSKYPFGNIFKDVAQGVFSQMFYEVDAGQKLSPVKNYDIIIEAHFDWVSNKTDCGFAQKRFFQAEGSLRILDKEFQVLWQSEQNIGEQTYETGLKMFDPDYISRVASVSISQSITSLVRGWTNELQKTYVLHKLVKSLQAAQHGTAGLSQGQSFPVMRSDVDDFPSAKAQGRKNAYAIIIGIEQYRQQLPAAEFAVHDAQTMADYLIKVLGYSEENVVTLLNDHAAKSDFEKYFEKWLPNHVEKNGTVFIYYSGHGAPNPKNKDAYLVPYDGDPSFIDQTGYSLKRMYDALGKLPAKEVIVALDSCFSGAGGRSVLAKGARPLVMNLQNAFSLSQNMIILSAASGDQISATYGEKGHGLFTYFLLKGIKNEDVVKADGTLEMKDLFSYIKPQVERIARKQYNNEQTPQLIEPKKR